MIYQFKLLIRYQITRNLIIDKSIVILYRCIPESLHVVQCRGYMPLRKVRLSFLGVLSKTHTERGRGQQKSWQNVRKSSNDNEWVLSRWITISEVRIGIDSINQEMRQPFSISYVHARRINFTIFSVELSSTNVLFPLLLLEVNSHSVKKVLTKTCKSPIDSPHPSIPH